LGALEFRPGRIFGVAEFRVAPNLGFALRYNRLEMFARGSNLLGGIALGEMSSSGFSRKSFDRTRLLQRRFGIGPAFGGEILDLDECVRGSGLIIRAFHLQKFRLQWWLSLSRRS
jgi:hypothetical protein